MPASKTSLNIAAYQVGSDVLLGRLRGYEYDPAPQYADVHPVNIATAQKALVKRSPVLRATQIFDASGSAATNLNVTAFSVASASYLGSLRNVTLEARNEFDEASGVGDLVSFGQLVRASCTITGELLVPSATTLHELINRSYSPTASDHLATVTLTIAGATVSGTFAISARAQGQAGQTSRVPVTLEASGNLTGPTGSSLLAVALTGSGSTDLHIDTGFGKLGTPTARIPALIASVRLRADDASVVEIEYEFKLQTAENLAAS